MVKKQIIFIILFTICIALCLNNSLYAGANRDADRAINGCKHDDLKDALNRGADLSILQDLYGPIDLQNCFFGYGDDLFFNKENIDKETRDKNILAAGVSFIEYLLEHGMKEIPFYYGDIFKHCYPDTFYALKKHNAIGDDYLLELASEFSSSSVKWKDTVNDVKAIVESGIDINSADYHGATALIYFSGIVKVALNPTEADKNREKTTFEIVEYLISRGADIHRKDNNNQNALMWAAGAGNSGIVTLLIKHGADVNVSNSSDGNTPLMLAADRRSVECVRLLIESGAKVNVKNRAGLSPYQIALIKQNTEIAHMLEEKGADTKTAVPDKKIPFNMEPLYLPSLDDMQSFESIKDYKLFAAYENKDFDAIKKAVEEEECLNSYAVSRILDREKFSPFAVWLRDRQQNFLKKKYTSGRPLRHPFPCNDELVEQSGKGNKSRVMELIKSGVDVDSRDREKHLTALMAASSNGKYDIVKFLIESGADVNIENDEGVTAFSLSYGYENDSERIKKLLISAGADLKNIGGRASSQFINTMYYGKFDRNFFDMLINAGADVNRINYGETPLMHAVTTKSIDVVKYMVKSGAKIGIKDKNGNDALAVAASKGSVEIIDFLLSQKAPPDSPNRYMVTPLMHACANGHAGAVKRLISAGADVNAVDDEGYTPLIYAVKSGNAESVEILIANKARVNIKTRDGISPLLMESFDPDVRIRKALTDAGAKPHDSFKTDRMKYIFFSAVANGTAGSVKRLIAEKAEVDARDTFGRTPLYNACWYRNADKVKMLLKAGADVNAKAIDGSTPIIAACIAYDYRGKQQEAIVRMLIDAGADVNAADNSGRTALMVTAQNWYLERREYIMKELVKAGADVNKKNKMGMTAVYYLGGSELFSFSYNLMDILANAGADINARTLNGMTPLMFFSINKLNIRDLDYLLDRKIDIKAKDNKGRTALNYALANNRFEIAEYLLKKGISHSWDSRYFLGLCSLSEKKYAEAVSHLKQAVKLKKDHRIFCDLGLAYLGQKKYTDAEKAFKEAQKISPKEPMPLYHLACLYGQKKDDSSAMCYLKNAISLGYKNYFRIMSEKRFARIREMKEFKKLVKWPDLY